MNRGDDSAPPVVAYQGHPEVERVRIAMEELQYYCSKARILGVNSAHPYRAWKG